MGSGKQIPFENDNKKRKNNSKNKDTTRMGHLALRFPTLALGKMRKDGARKVQSDRKDRHFLCTLRQGRLFGQLRGVPTAAEGAD